MDSQGFEIGCGISEDDCHGGIHGQAGTLREPEVWSLPGSGQHRFMVRKTHSGIRLFEAGILTQFVNCVTISPNILLLIACSQSFRGLWD